MKQATREKYLKLYQECVDYFGTAPSQAQFADRCGISRTRVSDIAVSMDVVFAPGALAKTNATDECVSYAIDELLAEGVDKVTLKSLHNHTGMAVSTIRRSLERIKVAGIDKAP